MNSIYLRGAPALALALGNWKRCVTETAAQHGVKEHDAIRYTSADACRAVARAVYDAELVLLRPSQRPVQGEEPSEEEWRLCQVEIERLQAEPVVYRQRLEEQAMQASRERELAARDLSRVCEERDALTAQLKGDEVRTLHRQLENVKEQLADSTAALQLARQRLAALHEKKVAWAWAGDGTDDLKSMSESMVVVMTARQLRQLHYDAVVQARAQHFSAFWYARSDEHVFGPDWGDWTRLDDVDDGPAQLARTIHSRADLEEALQTLRSAGLQNVRAVRVSVGEDGTIVETDPG